MEMFEEATRKKIRWLYRGTLSVEDLWDLSVEHLDEIYKTLAREARESREDSLLVEHRTSHVLILKTNIVKHIVSVKIAEVEEAEKAADRKAQKARLLDVLAHKQDEALLQKTPEEIQAMIEAL